MNEYFIVANSFAAPFVSDTSEKFVVATTPEEALKQYAAEYSHPAGLYAAVAYKDANAKAKGEEPVARWLCNHELEKQRLTNDMGAYSYLGHGPGDFEVDGKRHMIADPKGGKVITGEHASREKRQ